MTITDGMDPFHLPAGSELDAHIHHCFLKQALSRECPAYSTDAAAAEIVRKHLEREYRGRIVTGRTTMSKSPWFARYEIDRGNPTEVLAETYPLAICRLAVLRVNRV